MKNWWVQDINEIEKAFGVDASKGLSLEEADVRLEKYGPNRLKEKKEINPLGIFIVSTVPDHFLEEHLWNHVAKKHLPNIFLWTFGSLLVIELLVQNFDIEKSIGNNYYIVLLMACMVGIIPESGPHLIFVSLFAEGMIPFSILLASSIVQDGHGMLPMLAHSRKKFLQVKGINFIVGFGIGAIALLMGL